MGMSETCPHEGSCHCGAQAFEAPPPDSVTRCTCSICSKRGSLAAFYAPEAVVLSLPPERLTAMSGATG